MPSEHVCPAHRPSDGESACRRDSVQRLPAPGWPSICAAYQRAAPEGSGRAARPLLGLAPGGVCRAARVTPDAGALLPHRFTLTCAAGRPAAPSAVCSLWHFPAGRPDWPLASTLPCGVPTFLDPVTRGPCRGHPADSPSHPVCQPHSRVATANQRPPRSSARWGQRQEPRQRLAATRTRRSRRRG